MSGNLDDIWTTFCINDMILQRKDRREMRRSRDVIQIYIPRREKRGRLRSHTWGSEEEDD